MFNVFPIASNYTMLKKFPFSRFICSAASVQMIHQTVLLKLLCIKVKINAKAVAEAGFCWECRFCFAKSLIWETKPGNEIANTAANMCFETLGLYVGIGQILLLLPLQV